MLQVLLQATCISLITIGACFGIIELRSNFNRSFLYVGIVVILLCLFSSIDLWNQQSNTTLYWTTIQHVIFCFVPPFLYNYLLTLVPYRVNRISKYLYVMCGLCAVLFFSGLMFSKNAASFSPTILYLLSFLPYIIFTIILCLHLILANIRHAVGKKSFILFLNLIGFINLTIFATFDLIRVLRSETSSDGISYTIIGVICFGIILTYIFTENLVSLLNERSSHINKLKSAYQELEHARDLSELGKSTSIINHEIKNYSFIIRGYAELLKEPAIGAQARENLLDSMISSIDDLSRFSNEILDFSKAKIISNRPLNICNLIKSVIDKKFSKDSLLFSFSGIDNEVLVHGDWKKLEQAFVNMFMNAIEARSNSVRIKILPSQFVLLITIEDDGIGCTSEELEKIFTAFYTTKDNGTGLGLTTSRSIIEGHGGHISLISKNVLSGEKEHGCIFNITFPTFVENHDQKDNIVLIEESIEQLSFVIQTFRNACVNPFVLPSATDLNPAQFKPSLHKIVGSPACISKVKHIFKEYHCYSLVPISKNLLYAVESMQGGKEHAFSEEFILFTLLK